MIEGGEVCVYEDSGDGDFVRRDRGALGRADENCVFLDVVAAPVVEVDCHGVYLLEAVSKVQR